MIHYVYVYCDPRKPGIFQYPEIETTFNFEPFYVGSGKEYRWRRHITNYEIEWNYNTIKNGKVKKLISEGYNLLEYVVFVKKNLPKEESLLEEQRIIRIMGRINNKTGILANLTDGGEGWKGAKSPFKGKTYTEIHGREKADKLKEVRRKNLVGNNYGTFTKGKKYPPSFGLKIREKALPVKQLDLNLNIIKVWRSVRHASEELNINISSISNVLGKQKTMTSGGFKWEYIHKQNNKYYV